ncbi:MAG: VirB8/TrbF family protein [Alphaproteobacteria bacterium]|nr:VirB8/TrbF family protein [Alphaproteobacteria bacterium]
MAEQDEHIAESIRSGAYFTQARAWFEVMYIGPISERSFFLLIAFLAALVALFSASALVRLMPLTDRSPVLVPASARNDDIYMSLLPLTEGGQAVNPSILQFFVTQYVIAREGYFSQTFVTNARFVRAQSDVAAYNAYAVAYTPGNAASPFAALGEYGQRLITIHSVRMGRRTEGKGSAEVTFSAETRGVDAPSTTRWTARLEYIYTELATRVVDNVETGEKDLDITDPHFQVVNYVLEQN